MPPNNEETTFLTKILIYILGVALGVGAKLAVMHKEKSITWKDVLVNSIVAFAAAYLTWQVLYTAGYPQMANVVSVICGRFADDTLKFAWKMLVKLAGNAADDISKTNRKK